MSTSITFDEQNRIENLLLGKSVVNVEGDTLTLSDGVEVKVVPNDGGCSCGAGDYHIATLNRVENIITDVKFKYDPSNDYTEGEGYQIFVLAGDEKINLLHVDGTDGNGYYGTGFHLTVIKK